MVSGKEMLNGVQAIGTHIDVTDPTFTGLKAALEVRDEVKGYSGFADCGFFRRRACMRTRVEMSL